MPEDGGPIGKKSGNQVESICPDDSCSCECTRSDRRCCWRYDRPIAALPPRVPTNGAVSYAATDDIEKDYNEAISAISVEYAGDIDYEKATQAAIQGMLSTLDPHSMYFPYNEFKKLREDQDSKFFGIGVTIAKHRDGVYIQSAVEDTPAGRLGLRYGDRILEVDGDDAREWSSEQVSKRVRGGKDEPVTIKVNAGIGTPLTFTVRRDGPCHQYEAYMLRPGTGYIVDGRIQSLATKSYAGNWTN